MGTLIGRRGRLTPEGYELLVIRSPRARRVTIRVLPGRVRVTIPLRLSESLADEFLESRREWIHGKLALFAANPGPTSEITAEDGSSLWVFGKRTVLEVSGGSGPIRLDGGSLHAAGGSVTEKRIRRFLDGLLLSRVQLVVDEFKEMTGLAPSRIKLRTTRSRWGSCSPSGGIMVNRKLVHAPLFVVDYIVAHELTHLVHHNHSSAFWKELRRFHPDTSEARKWLRLQGAHLLQ
ncbi:MAG TPA: SprT family zinc-dependent metalloprotease [Candidatus Sabulitectum sp.]|nr:SprT family zinc-dependent metalloprotease [Candidatus Sabulitectum sp.]